MSILHAREQHPVGQGFFHSGEIHFGGDDRPFSYVYDCGSMPMFDKQRSDAIEHYLRDKTELDILFLSHIHVDHVRGVRELLDTIKVKAVVMPLMTIGERIFAYLASVNEEASVANDDFYRDFILDPAVALGARGVAEVIFIRGGGPGGAPGSDGGVPEGLPPDTPEDPDVTGITREVELSRRWRLIGDVSGRERSTRAVSFNKTIPMTIVRHTCAIVPKRIFELKLHNVWQLATFVDDEVQASQNDFFDFMIAGDPNLGIPAVDLEEYHEPTEAIKDLITHNLSSLQGAYRLIASNINFTSMSLYSGPIEPVDVVVHHRHRFRPARDGFWRRTYEDRSAWLGTGDADLKTKKRRGNFLRHFGSLAGKVGTLTVPHHGSENNFDPELVETIEPNLCVVAAAQYKGWRHPGTTVVQDIGSLGIPLAVVTNGPASRLIEMFLIEIK